jgi:hypothetical protein
MKILRLLLVGGLLSPEANHRHRRLKGTLKCTCGGNPTNHHISWECPIFKDLRAPALAALSQPIEEFPMCFQYTTLVPENVNITQNNLHQIQISLVNIWQRHIQDWHNAEDQVVITHAPSAPDSSTIAPAEAASSSTTQPEQNGHTLQPIPEGTGMFCVKCGIYTTYMKHIRLKILKNTCKFKSLPADQWLTKPGQQQATSRLDHEAKKLQDLNKAGHDFVWNRLTGRDESNPSTYGLIFCKKCERTWPWSKRHANIPRSICQRSKASAPAPDWVKNFDTSHAVSLDTTAQQNDLIPTDIAEASHIPRQRIRGKTRPNTFIDPHTIPNAEHVSSTTASGGSSLPRTGIG